MVKGIALAVALLCAGYSFAEIPKNPTRDQVIASCIIEKVTVQERVALQQCKTRTDAAELLISMYQDRRDTLNARAEEITNSFLNHTASDVASALKEHERVLDLEGSYFTAEKELKNLLPELKAAPAPKAKKKHA